MDGTADNLETPPGEPLTRREQEILVYLDEGFSAPEIAEQLQLAISSVKFHIANVYGKLGVNSKRQALTRARELGLLGADTAAVGQPSAVAQLAVAGQPAAPARAAAASEAPAPGESPYKGLRQYDEADAAGFFGREALAGQLAAQLAGPARFLAVVGASGSGKSSIVRAGLLPALRRGAGADGQRFDPICLFTPTAHPLEALAVSLTRSGEPVTSTTHLIDDLAHDERALHLYARRLASGGAGSRGVQHLPTTQFGQGQIVRGLNAPTEPAPARLLLVVDQFEELFTLCRAEAERQAFISNLLRAADPAASGPVSVLITLRADFYMHCAAYAELREALATQQVYIGPMAADELRQAVELPARRGRWEFEPGLVDQILRDVSDAPGALPLLSHALLATWQHRRGRTLTLRSYAEAGRVQGAIATTAETVYQSLAPEEQAIARSIFLRLTELGEGTQDTRRRVALAELLPAGGRPADVASSADAGGNNAAGETDSTGGSVAAVLKTLSDARLITQDEGVVEVAHEALIREWPTLRHWLSEDREGLRLHRRVTEDAQEWAALDHDDSELYRGPKLVQALEWAEWAPHKLALNAVEREFLEASQTLAEHEAAQREAQQQQALAAAQALAEAQRQRAEAETRRAAEQTTAAGRLRARNRVITAVGVLALLTAVVAGFFGVESNRNAGAAQIANTQSAQNLGAAQAAGTQVSAQRDEAVRQSNLAFANQLAAQATYLVTNNIPLGMLIAAQADHLSDLYVVRTTLHSVLAYSPHLRGFLIGHNDSVNGVAFSPDGKRLVSSSQDGSIRLWDTATHQPIGAPLSLGQLTPSSLAFSPDGKILAVGLSNATVQLWEMASVPTPGAVLAGHTSRVSSVAFSPDGALLAAGSDDTTILLWNVASGQPAGQPLIGHTKGVNGVAFSPDGTRLASSGLDESVRLWDVASGQPIGAPLVDESRVALQVDSLKTNASVAFSPDGKTVAASAPNSVHDIGLWDVSATPPVSLGRLIGHTDLINSLAFSPNGRTLASASADRTLRLWDVASRQPVDAALIGHDFQVLVLAFSPDGTSLASGGADHTIALWHTESTQIDVVAMGLAERACLIAGRNLTQAEWNQYLTGQPYQKTCAQWPEGH